MDTLSKKLKETLHIGRPPTDVEPVGGFPESLLVLADFLPAHPYDFSAIRNDPASSDAIGDAGDMAMSAVETSLAVLKEASAFAGKIPYISPVAGLLLQALKMRDASGFTVLREALYLTSTSVGGKTVRRRVEDCDGQSRESRWSGMQHRRVVQEI
jgi:hypothetical protein